MFPDGPVVPLCNQFQPSNPVYIRDCPSSSYQGCLTQTNGTHVTKTCTEVGLEDCKTANKIRYCYCKGELCNKEGVPTEAPVPLETETEDDEDLHPEGSGSYEELDSRQVETSSEMDLGIEVTQKQLPTTIKSVILTTPRPQNVGPVTATATNHPAQKTLILFGVISFLVTQRKFLINKFIF
ncbi:hypothetical protein RUM44_012559 [Polyplax serrata]|uniref:Activin types I and II receptor domain-containing protein n=1 Tax=Polyplax serrata TaxID=468196 RepID=A0ABR1BBM3_POLSC